MILLKIYCGLDIIVLMYTKHYVNCRISLSCILNRLKTFIQLVFASVDSVADMFEGSVP